MIEVTVDEAHKEQRNEVTQRFTEFAKKLNYKIMGST